MVLVLFQAVLSLLEKVEQHKMQKDLCFCEVVRDPPWQCCDRKALFNQIQLEVVEFDLPIRFQLLLLFIRFLRTAEVTLEFHCSKLVV